MSFKKKLGLGVASAVLGISLVGGGTFAYFSDTAEQRNTFASGTLDLAVDPEVNVELDNMKPGDWTNAEFDLVNDGSLDIKYVQLGTEYSVRDGEGHGVSDELADEYADSIMVKFLKNTGGDEDHKVIYKKSLYELANMNEEDIDDLLTEVDVEEQYVWPIPFPIGEEEIEVERVLESGQNANFDVQFEFVYEDEDQNHLQDLDLDLTWTFEGFQTDGEEL